MKQIAIITGGDSAEYEISISSANVVLSNLDPKKYSGTIIKIQDQKWTALKNDEEIEINKQDFSFKTKSYKIKFDYVFMALHGPPAENGDIQPYFDKLNIPYSSCSAKISALTFNKIQCNKKLTEIGFKCAKSLHYKINQKLDIDKISEQLGLPLFIKPNQSGSSFGASKVYRKNKIKEAINKALLYDDIALIEEFIDGKEVSCGVLNLNDNITALPITEIISDNEFFDFEAKYKGLSQEITPARINKNLTNQVQDISKSIFKKMNLKGVCRIDFIIMNNNPYVIEINTIPGLSKESIIPKQAQKAGISLTKLFNNWIHTTLNK